MTTSHCSSFPVVPLSGGVKLEPTNWQHLTLDRLFSALTKDPEVRRVQLGTAERTSRIQRCGERT